MGWSVDDGAVGAGPAEGAAEAAVVAPPSPRMKASVEAVFPLSPSRSVYWPAGRPCNWSVRDSCAWKAPLVKVSDTPSRSATTCPLASSTLSVVAYMPLRAFWPSHQPPPATRMRCEASILVAPPVPPTIVQLAGAAQLWPGSGVGTTGGRDGPGLALGRGAAVAVEPVSMVKGEVVSDRPRGPEMVRL